VPYSRDFVHWRFLDAGELSLRTVSLLPASKNQNKNRHGFLLDHFVGGCEKGIAARPLKL
jgi:hypothetical protein